jgi:putative ABC transport system permease protein
LRARVSSIQGASVAATTPDDIRRRGLGREFTITYRSELERNERVTAGAFWPKSPSPAAEVSVEQGVLDRAGLAVGDVIRFNVIGRTIEARVTSARSVNWVDARSGGFVFVFRPGPLDGAPHTYIAPLRGPTAAAARGRLQRAVVDAFPNVSLVDVREVLATAERVLGLVTLAVTVVGALVLATGTLILIGAVAMTKFQRVYEAAILKTVGATSRFIGMLLLAEYGLLGAVAGLVGSIGGLALSWALSRYALKVAWQPHLELAGLGVLAAVVLVAVVGLVASLDVLRRKPLVTLRGE